MCMYMYVNVCVYTHSISPNTVNSSRKAQRRGSFGADRFEGTVCLAQLQLPTTLAQLWRQLRRARRRHISMKKKLNKLAGLLCNSHLFGMATRQRL